jgi:glycine hydroxymethyltransferase
MDDKVILKDKETERLIKAEVKRQREGLELIPSENYVSRDVLTAMGSVFTNKYSEGYVKRRYYGGQQNTDQIEQLAIDRIKALFGADHANVQSLGGAQANEAVEHAWLEPGDTILGMDLTHGGHLTHGHPTTILAKLFNFIRYKMDPETGKVDFDKLREIAKKEKPKMVLVGYSSCPREMDYANFAAIAEEIGAVAWADVAHIAGLIAAGKLENPFDHGFQIISSTTHKTLRGPRGGMILTKGIVSNPLKPPVKSIENLPTLIDRTVFPGVQGGPHMHIIAAKAVAFYEAAQPEFVTYAQQVLDNAQALAKGLQSRGFKLVTNGTDNHMVLVDVIKSFGIDGKEAEDVLDSIGLTLNKNVIPDDPLPPYRPSGIRLGTPAATTRGLKEKDMDQIAEWMKKAIDGRNDKKKLDRLHNEVIEFVAQYPLPSDRPAKA